MKKKTIAIFCAGQSGDCLTISSVIKYREALWGDCHIVWYIADENKDLLKYQDVELRTFPRGFGYPIMVAEENKKLIDAGEEPTWEDWSGLVDENNHLNIELAKNCPSLAGINFGYFPAPHQMSVSKRHAIPYPLISKKVFGIPNNYEWHPVLAFSDEEIEVVKNFIPRRYVEHYIAIETMAGSGQSVLNDIQVRKSMEICREILGVCNFVFLSNKYLRGNELFPADIINDANNLFCADFTVRQCALIVDLCDLLISVSSGITVASSCWGNEPVPTIQYTGSAICSTETMALGRFELVTHDEKPVHVAENEFYERLKFLLNEIK